MRLLHVGSGLVALASVAAALYWWISWGQFDSRDQFISKAIARPLPYTDSDVQQLASGLTPEGWFIIPRLLVFDNGWASIEASSTHTNPKARDCVVVRTPAGEVWLSDHHVCGSVSFQGQPRPHDLEAFLRGAGATWNFQRIR